MAAVLKTIEILAGLDPDGINDTWIPLTEIEEIALARVAPGQIVRSLGTELMGKIYTLQQAGVTSPEEIAETLGITLRGAQTQVGLLSQLLTKIRDEED